MYWLCLCRYDNARQHLQHQCEAQMDDDCDEVILKMEDFPKVPILCTRAATGSGYCQCSASEKVGGKRFFLHRAAAMFRLYEERGITMQEMAGLLDSKTNHLLIMPVHHSKRNINPWYLCWESGAFNMSRLHCK